MFIPNHVFRARLFNKSDNQNTYHGGAIHAASNTFSTRKQTINLASINKTILDNLPIALPSPEEQREIVRRVETLFAFADALKPAMLAGREQIDQLITALLKRLFEGNWCSRP